MIPYFTFTEINLSFITIQVWGLMASIGFLCALFLSLKEAGRKNIDKDDIWNAMILSLIGMIIGSRIFYVISNFNEFGNLEELFNLNGGFSFLGGASLAGILVFVYAKHKKINLWKLADAITPGAIAAIVIVRIGCFLIYDHLGRITNLPWGRLYIDETVRHPIILYHIISSLAIFFIICYLKKRHLKNGLLFLYFAVYYLIFRFLTDFLRCSDLNICDTRYMNLTYTQWFILIITPFVIYLLTLKNMEQKKDDEIKEIKELDLKKTKKKVNPNVFLVIIGIALGVLVAGSFGINFSQNNNCARVLGETTDIFEENGITWVAFDDPIVNVTVISDKNCDSCNYDNTVEILKTNLVQTLKVNEVEFDSSEGKQLISSFEIKSVPAFVFDSKITETKNYEQAAQVFIEKDGQYFLDSVKVGLPVGRNLESIEIDENDAFKGPVDAKVTIIEFSEFQCPYCKKGKEIMDEIIKIYGEQVKLVFKHFPLISIHPEAQKAAEATECAGDQGKFWEMHDWMFDNQQGLAVDGLKTAAANLGMSSSEFNSCLDSGKYEEKVKNDSEEAKGLGLGGAPAFFINDQLISGAQPIEKFRGVIDKALAK